MFEQQFDLRFFEMGRHGEATPVTMLTLLEETAADHCLSIGYGLYDLLDKGVGWVLLSGRMVMDRYPEYKEKITIKTWLSSFRTFRGTRENLIMGEEGDIIGRAKGFWLFFDIERRRPARIFDDILEEWDVNPEESIEVDSTEVDALDSASHRNEFVIHRFDVDSYQHVNNLRYLQWAMESIPASIKDNCYLHAIDGNFVGEAQYGHTIESLAEPADSDKTFVHTIRDIENDKVCSTAKTVWKEHQ